MLLLPLPLGDSGALPSFFFFELDRAITAGSARIDADHEPPGEFPDGEPLPADDGVFGLDCTCARCHTVSLSLSAAVLSL